MKKSDILEANRTNAIIQDAIDSRKLQEKTLTKLVRKILWRKPLAEGWDDWHPQERVDMSVWQLRDALESAYMAGKNS